MCYERDYKIFEDRKKAEDTRVMQERRAGLIDRLLNDANNLRVGLNVVLGFIASEESWCLIPVDVNDASVTRVKERVGDVRRTTPFPLLARLLAPRKSVELIARTTFVFSVS